MHMMENYIIISPRDNCKPSFSLMSSKPVQQITLVERNQVNKMICYVQNALLEFQNITMKLNFLKTKHQLIKMDQQKILQLVWALSQEFNSVKCNIRTMLLSLTNNGYSPYGSIHFANVTDMDNVMLQKYLSHGPQHAPPVPVTQPLSSPPYPNRDPTPPLHTAPTALVNPTDSAPPPPLTRDISAPLPLQSFASPPNHRALVPNVSSLHQELQQQSTSGIPQPMSSLPGQSRVSPSNILPLTPPSTNQQQHSTSINHEHLSHLDDRNSHSHTYNDRVLSPNNNISQISTYAQNEQTFDSENQPPIKQERRSSFDYQPSSSHSNQQDNYTLQQQTSRPQSTNSEQSVGTLSLDDLDNFDRLVDKYVVENIDKLLTYDGSEPVRIKQEKLENDEPSCCSHYLGSSSSTLSELPPVSESSTSNQQQQVTPQPSRSPPQPSQSPPQPSQSPPQPSLSPQKPSQPITALEMPSSPQFATRPAESSNDQVVSTKQPPVPQSSITPFNPPNDEQVASSSTAFEFPPSTSAPEQYLPKYVEYSPKSIESPSALKKLTKPESSTIKYIAKVSPKLAKTTENEHLKAKRILHKTESRTCFIPLSHLVKSKFPPPVKSTKSEALPRPESRSMDYLKTSSKPVIPNENEPADLPTTTAKLEKTKTDIKRNSDSYVLPVSPKHSKRNNRANNHNSLASNKASSDEEVVITKVRYMARRTASSCVTKKLRCSSNIKKEQTDRPSDTEKRYARERSSKPKLSEGVSPDASESKETISQNSATSLKSETAVNEKRKSFDNSENIYKKKKKHEKRTSCNTKGSDTKISDKHTEVSKSNMKEIKRSKIPLKRNIEKNSKDDERSVDLYKKMKDSKSTTQRRMTDSEKMAFATVVLQRKKAKAKKKKEAERKLSIDTKSKLKEIPLLVSPEHKNSPMGSLTQPCSVKLQKLSKKRKTKPHMELFKLGNKKISDNKTKNCSSIRPMKPTAITDRNTKSGSTPLKDKIQANELNSECLNSKRTHNWQSAIRPSNSKRDGIDNAYSKSLLPVNNNNNIYTNSNKSHENDIPTQTKTRKTTKPLESPEHFEKNLFSIFNTYYD